jgi:hypothetical protein
MAAFRRLFALAIVCLASFSAAQFSDQAAAARVLGPRWRQMSRLSGMIFSGTVLGIEAEPAQEGRPLPLIVTKFRVNFAIAGVQPGQVVTVREWSGAWSMHRAMRSGQRMLIFLYPPGRLGLTSPVGGPAGQVVLDARGEIVRTLAAEAEVNSASAARLKSCPPEDLAVANVRASDLPVRASDLPAANFFGAFPQALKRSASPTSRFPADCAVVIQSNITLRQLKRAILNARRNSSAPPVRIKE